MLDDCPLVTVVVPAYNVEKFIQKTIKSILNQNYSNIELIVINDHSTDGTLGAIKKAALSDKRIRLISNAFNQGLSNSRNIGIKSAHGKYIEFVDGDDRLKKMLSIFL
ncbi:glycosyltransferase family 2 protein [Oenococcus oeni]|uniref:glycosyltransferase family 2 protein n=1 Tax=Oenococcus oeni TaxID=1247 RepID=UPI00067E43DB|nr:glycosyltransferase family 2 protein [Oenococcus oeni]KZD14628.1 putative glycosyltransferase [Oenococcus oeni]OIM42224.1 hypothetical protein ATX68_07790 [Oenococcus oeni]OLQ42804.1 hypothetical protein ATX63_07690 [Oenococcus oeni]PST69112.1 hypothetical protein BHC24_06720 [Oenococcus oeni]PST71656.1 hypothetical protein BGI67_08300 [Oenococcus oeni]